MAQPDWLGLYLQEDLDDAGDITSDPLFAADLEGVGRIVARERCYLAGVSVAAEIFGRLGASTGARMNDGSWVDAGAEVLAITGPPAAILKGERLALNILARMSGIATKTRQLMEELGTACSASRVAGTRKTTPGFRHFEKEAIRIAGGDPHRDGLYDAAMIKDNHREAAGSIPDAVATIRAAHPTAPLTVEVETLEDAHAAANAGADWILIDNQTPETGRAWAEAVWQIRPDIKVEASGGIAPEQVVDYGWADRISLGALTQNVRSIDFSLEWGA